jgi:hypothetical protein
MFRFIKGMQNPKVTKIDNEDKLMEEVMSSRFRSSLDKLELNIKKENSFLKKCKSHGFKP